MGSHAAFWAVTVRGLRSGPMWVLTRASLSCMDETGFLAWSWAKLANECRITVRSLESQAKLLAELELLVRGDAGFRVVGWLRSENFSENFSEKKESTKERKEFCLNQDEIPPAPLAGGSKQNRVPRRDRGRVQPVERIELQKFTTARCEFCDESHDWDTEPYMAPAQTKVACDRVRERIFGGRV